MSLTGRPVLVLAAALALLTPVLAVVLWDRVRRVALATGDRSNGFAGARRDWRRWLFAFVALNDYAGFRPLLVAGARVRHRVASSHEQQGGPASRADVPPDPSTAPRSDDRTDHAMPISRIGVQQAPAPDGGIWRILGNNPPEKWVDTGVTPVVTFDAEG